MRLLNGDEFLTCTTGKNNHAALQSINPHATRVPGPAT